MRVKAVDDTFRPEEIPLSYWIKKGSYYTVVNSFNDMNGVLLYELAEINLRELRCRYKGFQASRFVEEEPTLKKEVKEIKEVMYV